MTPAEPAVVVKLEPVDPLKMDIDEEDIEYEPDTLNEQLGVRAFSFISGCKY